MVEGGREKGTQRGGEGEIEREMPIGTERGEVEG